MKQTTFNPEELNAQFNAVKNEQSFSATVRGIEQMKAGDVFGSDCENPERDVIVVDVEVDSGETFTETYSLPKSAGSWQRENFKLGAYAKKYGGVPFVGQKIDVMVNKEGYYRVAV
jgi:hypothetical protein